MVILLYTSRACYNLIVLALTDVENINSFDYDWYNVSDQVNITLLPSPSMLPLSTYTQEFLIAYMKDRIFSFLRMKHTHYLTLPHMYCLWSCRQTWGPIWVMQDMWCLGWFSSSGNFCPPPWWSSSSGFASQHKTGWGIKGVRACLRKLLCRNAVYYISTVEMNSSTMNDAYPVFPRTL